MSLVEPWRRQSALFPNCGEDVLFGRYKLDEAELSHGTREIGAPLDPLARVVDTGDVSHADSSQCAALLRGA